MANQNHNLITTVQLRDNSKEMNDSFNIIKSTSSAEVLGQAWTAVGDGFGILEDESWPCSKSELEDIDPEELRAVFTSAIIPGISVNTIKT